VLLISACTGSDDAEPPGPTPDQRLAARVTDEIRILAASYAATITRHPDTRAELAPLAAEHEAHIVALVALTPTPSDSASPSNSSASPSPSPPPVPPTAAAAHTSLATSERAAAARRRGQAGRAGPELARLLASIAACEAVHAMLLGGRA
jgi:hypothetical protein